jgi:diphosphomevalonate decarboxylase
VTLQGINRPLDYVVTLKTERALDRDRVFIDGVEEKGEIYHHVVGHLDIMRGYAGFKEKLLVFTKKTFPVGSGLAGSAASSSAMAEAFAGLLEKATDRRSISIMARRGSGSAARSVFGGFVLWQKGISDQTSYAIQLFDENHWDIRDVIAMVDFGPKKLKSIEGMKLSRKTCPESIYSAFTRDADLHIEETRSALDSRDIDMFGAFYETENYLFRRVCLKTEPQLDYWTKTTQDIIDEVANLRNDGVQAYAGTDAGPNVHILTSAKHVEGVIGSIQKLEGVQGLLHCRIGRGSHLIDEHLI